MPFGGSNVKSPLDTSLEKLYEMRMYKVEPQHMKKFIQITTDNMPIRVKYSKLLGYWFTEFGTLNRVIHLWEYDSYQQRSQVRDSLSKDEQWLKFLNVMKPLLKKEKNISLRKLSDLICYDTPPNQPGNVHYRLNVFVLKEPHEANACKFKELADRIFKELADDKIDSFQHIGTFIADSGKMNQIIQYVRCSNLDDAALHKKFCENKELQNLRSEIEKIAVLGNSQILKPAPFSPLK
ncbi:unnamed protein product [Gordionus sp. m RMFG-2023]